MKNANRSAPELDADSTFREEFARRAGARFSMRSAVESDESFLSELLTAVHRESWQRLGGEGDGWLDGPLLELQLRARALAYRSTYPDARDYIISARSGPIGRMLLDWSAAHGGASVGVDLAVLPGHRTGAAGWHALRAWLAACDRLGQAAMLHVMPENPARRLYLRLGFVALDADAFPIPMRRPPRTVTTA